MYKIIFMMTYGSKLKISEETNIKIKDMGIKIFVKEGIYVDKYIA